MTASWQLLYTGSLLCALDIQYILKGIQEPGVGAEGVGGGGSGNSTCINRNQTFSRWDFWHFEQRNGGWGVKGCGNWVWEESHNGPQPLSGRQVVMHELGGMEMWRHGFPRWSLKTAMGYATPSQHKSTCQSSSQLHTDTPAEPLCFF